MTRGAQEKAQRGNANMTDTAELIAQVRKNVAKRREGFRTFVDNAALELCDTIAAQAQEI